MFFIDFDPFLFFLMGFDCFEHDGGRCGWGTVWMGTALNKFDLIGCVFYWAGTAPGGTAWGTAFPNIRTVWSEVSRQGEGITKEVGQEVGGNRSKRKDKKQVERGEAGEEAEQEGGVGEVPPSPQERHRALVRNPSAHKAPKAVACTFRQFEHQESEETPARVAGLP